MWTPYNEIQTKEQLLEKLKISDEIISSIPTNVSMVMEKCIDVDNENYFVFDSNKATIVGMFTKQYKLFKQFLFCVNNNQPETCFILQRIIYECYIKMLYLIKYGDKIQREYRLISYKDRYIFYDKHKNEFHGYFKVRNDKFLLDLQYDGFTLDDVKSVCDTKKRAFGGKNMRQLIEEIDDDSLYSSLYGIASDSIHSDWGDIRQVYLGANTDEGGYIAGFDLNLKIHNRYTISFCSIMVDSILQYIEWVKKDFPHLGCFNNFLCECKRISNLYYQLVMDDYNAPDSKYMYE